MTAAIPQMEPVFTTEDIGAVSDYMASGGWVTEFDRTRRLEEMIAQYTGAAFCSIAPNGTLALSLAMLAAGIGPGDEVIVPDLTMAASATSALFIGAKVKFVDVEPRTLCLDLALAEAAITDRTSAIVFVSLNGRAPRELPAFVARCAERGVTVIEDAAQSLGSRLGGRHLGRFGSCGCFSFSSQKIVTMGQGGAVITDDEAFFARMKRLRDFGRRSGGSDHYDVVGWNLKFTDLQAVLGISQMTRLDALVDRKRRLFGWYERALADIPGVTWAPLDTREATPWFVDVLVEGTARDGLAAHLRSVGIGSRPFYPALHAEPAFGHAGSFPVAERIAREGLWLPSSLRVTEDDVARIGDAVREYMTRNGAS